MGLTMSVFCYSASSAREDFNAVLDEGAMNYNAVLDEGEMGCNKM